MENDQISRTAQITAYCRGHHAEHDHPKIFDDFLANSLLTEEEHESIERQMMTALRTFNPVAAASFSDQKSAISWIMQAGASSSIALSRARYTEERLEEAVDQGVCQYVILGAGLDTFAFRRPELMERLKVFELDHPATQSYKRHRLLQLGWEHPARLHFIPVDFTNGELAAALAASDFDPQAPTFFSWLGVTYYLQREVVFATLQAIAEIAPKGSSLVFDYLDTEAFISVKASPRVVRMLMSVRDLGEPMQAGFEPLTLADELANAGLELIEDLCPADIHSRYFLGRTDHFRACEHTHFANARVK